MHNAVKWPNIFLKSCGVNTARFLKYIWPFYVMDERVNKVVVMYRFSKKVSLSNLK